MYSTTKLPSDQKRDHHSTAHSRALTASASSIMSSKHRKDEVQLAGRVLEPVEVSKGSILPKRPCSSSSRTWNAHGRSSRNSLLYWQQQNMKSCLLMLNVTRQSPKSPKSNRCSWSACDCLNLHLLTHNHSLPGRVPRPRLPSPSTMKCEDWVDRLLTTCSRGNLVEQSDHRPAD